MTAATEVESTFPPRPSGDPTEILAQLVRDPAGAQRSCWREYGDVWAIPTPSGPFVFLAHPDLVRQLAGYLTFASMVDWDVDGVQVWGEDHDSWPHTTFVRRFG